MKGAQFLNSICDAGAAVTAISPLPEMWHRCNQKDQISKRLYYR